MRTILFTALIIAGLASGARAEAEEPYFSARSMSVIHQMYEGHGYRVEEDGATWLLAPDGTRVRLQVTTGEGGCCTGILLEAYYLVGQSRTAVEMAQYYQQTNPIAGLAFTSSDGEIGIILRRFIEFGPGRTEVNVIANTQLVFQMVPYFTNALVQADPDLARRWQEEQQ